MSEVWGVGVVEESQWMRERWWWWWWWWWGVVLAVTSAAPLPAAATAELSCLLSVSPETG